MTKNRLLVFLCFICLMLSFSMPAAAEEIEDVALTNLVDGWPQMDEIHEATGFVTDVDSGGVIYSKNSDTIRYPASLTKLLTALIVLENCDLKDKVVMTYTGTQMVASDSTNAQTVEGEEFTVEQCLYMLLLKSANDIANQLAEHTGGTLEHFVEMMNERAREIGCKNTHFTNPSGMPDTEHYTTAEDLALIMKECLNNETFRKISATEAVTIPPTNKTTENRTYTNHNALVVTGSDYYYPCCIAGKTGYTDAAWRTFAAAAEKDGRTLVCVVLRGPDRSDFTDAAKLFDYGFNEFDRIEVPGGCVTLPRGKSLKDVTTAVVSDEEPTSVSSHMEYYYNGLLVGRGDVTE